VYNSETMATVKFESDVAATWKEMTHKDAKTNWMLIHFTDPSEKEMLGGVQKGEGGVKQLSGSLDEKKVMFGVFRVLAVDVRANVTSVRPKYVTFTFVGRNVGPLKRARVSTLKPEVLRVFMGSHATLETSEAADFEGEPITKLLLTAGAAHKPTYYEFAADHKIELPPHT